MKTCCIPRCKSKSPGVSFFKFPSNKERRVAWLKAITKAKIRDSSWVPSEHSVVCQKHFRKADFSKSTKNKTLLPYSVISVFPRIIRKQTSKKKSTLPRYSSLHPKKDEISLQTWKQAAQIHELSRLEMNGELPDNLNLVDAPILSEGKTNSASNVASFFPPEANSPPNQIPEFSQENRSKTLSDFSEPLDTDVHFGGKTYSVNNEAFVSQEPRYSFCCVRGCKTGCQRDRQNKKELGKRVYSIFYPPQDLLEQWKKLVPIKLIAGEEITTSHGVCELHFAEKYLVRNYSVAMNDTIFIYPKRGPRRLQPGAVPTIYPGVAEKEYLKIIPFSDNRAYFDPLSNYSALLDNIIEGKTLIIKVQHTDVEIAKIKLQSPEGMFLASLLLNNQSSDVNILDCPTNQNIFTKVAEFLARPCDMQSGPSSSDVGTKKNKLIEDKNLSLLTSFKELKEDVKKIKLPPKWKVVQCFPTVLPFVKWNENYVAERKFSIDYNFKLKVYLGNREVYFEYDAPKNPHDILAIILKIDSLQLCNGCFDETIPSCSGVISTEALSSSDHRGFCANCISYKKMRAKTLWQKVYYHFIAKKRICVLNRDYERLQQSVYRAQQRVKRLKRTLKVEEKCSSAALEFFT